MSSPLLAGRVGNLFVDSVDAASRWYLPTLTLAGDPDGAFAFAVEQENQQADGRPFNTARLTFGATLAMPGDVATFARANPGVRLQPIALTSFVATLNSFYTDAGGAQQQRSFRADAQGDLTAGSVVLSFATGVFGDAVAALYQDLRLFGKTTLVLSAVFAVLTQRFMPDPRPDPPDPDPHPNPHPGPHPVLSAMPIRLLALVPPRTGHWVFMPMPQAWTQSLALGVKYQLDDYQLRFTITPHAGPSRIITGVGDLATFGAVAVGVVPFKALGDIGLAYPTLASAYLDVLGRELILVPRTYAILRGKSGCAAQCLARLDINAGPGGCRFEFDFTVAPQVSMIELRRLANQLASHPDIKDYQIGFPGGLSDQHPSNLQTAFQSSVAFGPGTAAHSFSVTVVVRDDGVAKPAVADANLFILQLCSATGAAPVGVLNVRLDTGDTAPVACALLLDFVTTTGTDDLVATIDAANKVATLRNQSPLDLTVSRVAVATGTELVDGPGPQTLAAGASLSLPITGDPASTTLVAEAQLALSLPGPAMVAKLLNLSVVDVAETQFVIAADASAVDFARVQSIAITVTFAALPTMIPPQLALSHALMADTTHIVVPIEDAIFALVASVQLAITFVDGFGSPRSGAASTDFVQQPVFVITQTLIDDLPTI